MNTIEEKGLPCNLDAERFVLGSILMDDSLDKERGRIREIDKSRQ